MDKIATTKPFNIGAVCWPITMKRKELLKHLATVILEKQKDSPVLVGIDGVDASGKTTLAEDLVNELKGSGRPVIRASIDGFHNPKSIRYTKGEASPEGYYFDSFNHKAMTEVLLDPLSSGKLQYKTAVFDYRTDSEVVLPVQTATKDSILIMEGIFCFALNWSITGISGSSLM